MKKFWILAFLPACAVFAAPPDGTKTDDKPGEKVRTPFYEKYLSDEIPGDRAIRDLTRQIEEKPDDPALHNDLGNLLARRGFAKEAVEQYRAAEKLDRNSYLPPYNEGLLWEKEGKPSAAMNAFRRSIRLKRGFPFSHFHLGVLEEREGRDSTAVAELAKALRIDNSLRLPSRNPLAVQTRLLYRASVANYERDIAAAVLVADGEFFDPSILARLSPERPIDSGEVIATEEPVVETPVVAVPVPQTIPGKTSAPQPEGREGRVPRRSRQFSPRPRTQFPPRVVPAPATPPAQPPPAAEPAPEEQPPPQENPPADEEPPPPPFS